MKYSFHIYYICLHFLFVGAVNAAECSVKVFAGHEPYTIKGKRSAELEMFKFEAVSFHPAKAFIEVSVKTNLTKDIYNLYQGSNCSQVTDAYNSNNHLFGLLRSISVWKTHHVNPFNDTIIGIDTDEPYEIRMKTTDVNLVRFGGFIFGVFLFVFASGLVRNVVFFYAGGCTSGLALSLLLVAFVVYRFAPKKLIGVPIIVGGWTVSMYMLSFVWSNFTHIVMEYQKYVIGYFAIVILVSFAYCYYRGPPTDTRSHDVMQWFLQLVALVCIYCSSQIPEVSYATMVILLIHNFAKSWFWAFGRYFCGGLYNRLFPPKHKFLSEEEYEQQTRETTQKELKQLQTYCRSPEANAWKLTSAVRNPSRLARFVDGLEEHISDDEIMLHDTDADVYHPRWHGDNAYDDEVEEDFDNEEDWEEEILIRRTPIVSSRAVSSRTSTTSAIRVPRGMSAIDLVDQLRRQSISQLNLSRSGVSSRNVSMAENDRQTPLDRNRRHRYEHVHASRVPGLPRPTRQQSSSSNSTTNTGSLRSSPRIAKSARPEYMSSDSEIDEVD